MISAAVVNNENVISFDDINRPTSFTTRSPSLSHREKPLPRHVYFSKNLYHQIAKNVTLFFLPFLPHARCDPSIYANVNDLE